MSMLQEFATDFDPPVELAERLVKLLDVASAAIDLHPKAAASALLQARQLVHRTLDSVCEEPSTITLKKGGLAPWQFNKVKRYVASNLGSRLSGAILADLVLLSVAHFSRAFKASAGMSPHDYVTKQRVAACQAMMMNSDESLADIAMACGFCDQAHLCQIFRRVVGKSPSAWRRLHRLAAREDEQSSLGQCKTTRFGGQAHLRCRS